MPLPPLPIDIFQAIIGEVASQEAQSTSKRDGSPSDLASWSLVAKDLVDISQRLLFQTHTVTIGSDYDDTPVHEPDTIQSRSTLRFMQQIIKKPKLGSYVKKLAYDVHTDDVDSEEVAEGLKTLSIVRELRIGGLGTGWEIPLSDSRWGSAVLAVLSRGTVDTLTLSYLGVRLGDLSRIPMTIGKLALDNVTIVQDHVASCVSALARLSHLLRC